MSEAAPFDAAGAAAEAADDSTLTDLELAATLVREAGTLALQMRGEGLQTHTKTSVSDVVTAADHAAERLVGDRLRAARPDDGILGEEGTAKEPASGRTWVIDPVDGTYNFASGLSHWCSALALTGPAGVVLGAVYHPQSDELWLGGPELPTTRNGEPVERIEDRPLDQISAATYLHPTRFTRPEIFEPWKAATSRVATVRMLGSSSVDLASVAGGRIGVWYQHSCPDWDWLPGKALVEGAGGATALVQVGPVRWHVAGAPTGVAGIVAALGS